MLRLSIVFLLLAIGCSSKPSLKKKQASLYFAAGTQSLVSRDYTNALQSLLKANEMEPGNPDILNNLGMAYYFKNEKDLAIKHLQESLEINPNQSDARLNLGSIKFQNNDYNGAEELYNQVLKDLTYDKQARTLYNLGMLEIDGRRNVSAAEEYFKRSIKEDENYCPSYYQIAMIQLARRQLKQAYKNFKEAGTGTCYTSPAPHYYQAVTLVEMGKIAEARIKLDEVEKRFAKTPFAAKARLKHTELNNLQVQQARNNSTPMASPEF